MNGLRITVTMLCLVAAGFAPSMRADEFNHETHFTTNQPLQVENTVLAPGQYILKLTDLIANRVVVSITQTARSWTRSSWVFRRIAWMPATRS